MNKIVLYIYEKYSLFLILLSAVFMKLAILVPLYNYAYYDVLKALAFGKGYFLLGGHDFIKTHIINSKTFIGPVLWFFVYDHFGAWGLKFISIFCFVVICLIQYSLGRKAYPRETALIAVLLFAFYPGVTLSVLFGEQDDNLSMLIFTLGVLIYAKTKKILLPTIIMWLSFIFKFSTFVFYLGFIGFLLARRDWKPLALSVLGLTVLFLGLNLFDGFQSLRSLSASFAVQKYCSSWQHIGFKMFSTGMVFFFLMSLRAYYTGKNSFNLLFLCLSASYLVYVLLFREAYSACFMAGQSLIFSSFLIAEFILNDPLWKKIFSRAFIALLAVTTYLLLTTLVTFYDVHRSNKYDISLIGSDGYKKILYPKSIMFFTNGVYDKKKSENFKIIKE